MSDGWYETVDSAEPITQGDLIAACPLISWQSGPVHLSGQDESESLSGKTEAVRADVVVMTQACDLEHGKVENVILCPQLTLEEYKPLWEAEMASRRHEPTKRAWRRYCSDIRDGFVWNLTLLDSQENGEPSTVHRIVDFHEVYSLPRTFLESLLIGRGQQRLRLLPPYREHLSQSFARFFMRVGLPVPIVATW